MPLELRPKFKVLIEDFEGFLVVLRQFDFLPKLIRQMGSFNSFHVQVASTFPLKHCGIAGIGKWARVPVAEASEVVLIPAERLVHCFSLERAVAVVDDLPDHVVLDHAGKLIIKN